MRILSAMFCAASLCVVGSPIRADNPPDPIRARGAVGKSETSGAAALSRESANEGPHSIREDMAPILVLLQNHKKITLIIRMLRHGAKTITTSTDPTTIKMIQLHAVDMKLRVELGNILRPTDPIFIEIFRHHTEIRIRLKFIHNGVIEWETSRNPQVVLLIQAHARSVKEFVKFGLPATRRNTPLPPGYHETGPSTTTGYPDGE